MSWRSQELLVRILGTLFLTAMCRIGEYVRVPNLGVPHTGIREGTSDLRVLYPHFGCPPILDALWERATPAFPPPPRGAVKVRTRARPLPPLTCACGHACIPLLRVCAHVHPLHPSRACVGMHACTHPSARVRIVLWRAECRDWLGVEGVEGGWASVPGVAVNKLDRRDPMYYIPYVPYILSAPEVG